ncbi:6-carboxytetrahydropterin synthase [Marivirga sp. S37H4]|uniref:6-carboxy-5,6,7,8-tetrahydropterin synthase n=1 Tax=Marivirga aurantiaca TaxID=2802615 RepID=A0A934WVV3_9BACT|nr:6-carboxytetrahydropterin synthase [Marivirga aurantiaca]MBK6263999.1 6-carboxytetrahydropterin synthase [Marivirga aurantiaca]
MLSITKEFRFEAAHRISNHGGDCKNLHGHSYILYVTVSAEEPDEQDMLIDFKLLKSIVKEQVLNHFDHVLILKRNKPNEALQALTDQKICWFEHEPTVERMLLFIRDALIHALPTTVQLYKLKLYETASSFGEWENKP